MGEQKNYKEEVYISRLENGRLSIENSKERLIMLAKKEIKEWQKFLKKLEEKDIEE